MSESIYKVFSHIIPPDRLHESEEVLDINSIDETEDLYFRPNLVAEPVSTEEVSALIATANENDIPVTAAGARTGLSGGALAVNGGLALSLRRMNKIIAIDEINHQAVVQPGVITEVLQNAAEEKGLFYAVDPASRGTCTIGGNLAENSGGPRAVKYGVTKDWVLNLEVVLADGNVIETGANTLKTFFKIRLPAALPQCFVGFKYAAINATVGAVIAEFIGSDKGLGFYISIVTGNMRPDLAFAGIFFLTCLGLSVFGFVTMMEKLLIPWHISMKRMNT